MRARLATADRGALSLEGGGVIAALRSEPALGTGNPVLGTLGGATLGIRFAFSNQLEVIATVDWFAPAPFYNPNTAIVTSNGTFHGQLQSRVGGLSARVGAQYVRGLEWKVRLGGEVGLEEIDTRRLDLVDDSQPAPRSFGLGLGSRTTTHLALVALAGVEWAFTDHLSFALTPHFELPHGGGVRVTLPLTVAYSWYLF